MKQVIVTGGSGFIGSWLISALLEQGVKVTALLRDKKRLLPEFSSNPHVSVVVCDFGNLQDVQIDTDVKFDAFYHLGWGGVSPEHKNDVDIQLDNIKNSIEAIQLCKRLGCKVFISSGTVAEYVFCKDIMDVNAKQTPNDIYGAAKVSTHYMLEVLAKQLNQPFIWTVVPSTFGERRTDNNIITYTIKSLLTGNKPKYGNLEQLWDFLYVSEVARALYLIGKKGIPGKTYGIGSGVYKPLKDYIVAIRDIINPELALGIGDYPSMSEQTFSSCVNIYELIKDTGFIPEVGFDEGIKRTIEYFKVN